MAWKTIGCVLLALTALACDAIAAVCAMTVRRRPKPSQVAGPVAS